jgi:uncharacterized GH25 family protein
MSKNILVMFFMLALVMQGRAQEFWMHAGKFNYKQGERLEVSFKIGETFIGEAWDVKRDQIERLTLRRNTTSVDLRDSLVEGNKNNLNILLKSEGTHFITVQLVSASIERSADEFNVHLKEYGLDEILEERRNSNTLSMAAKESFSRYTKLLFQVGTKLDDTYKATTGFPVEIIAEKNPYSLRIGDAVRFKILFDGKPMFGVRAKVWNRYQNRTTIQNIYTEKDGTFEARISNPGPWMVSVVRMTSSKTPGADWQSYWSSLVFGIEK